MGFLIFQKKNKKQFTSSALPELIFDKDTDSNISSTNSSPVSDSFVTESHIPIFSQNSLLNDILNELPKQGKQLYSSAVSSSNVSTDYCHMSEFSKSDSSSNGTHLYSDSAFETQDILFKENISQDRTSENYYKHSAPIMKLPSTKAFNKNLAQRSNINEAQFDTPIQLATSNSISVQFSLEAKKHQRVVNGTNEGIYLGEQPVKNTYKNLEQLNNISISRMKERHRQECRKSGQWSHVPSKAQPQAQNSMFIAGSQRQRQRLQQLSPIITSPSLSPKYQVCTPSISSRTKCHPLPPQSPVIFSDLNQLKYGSLRSTVPKYRNTQENISKQHTNVEKYGREVKRQCSECSQQILIRNDYYRLPKHHVTHNINSISLKNQMAGEDAAFEGSVCIKQRRNQNILKLGKIFEQHMSNNPKLKAEIDRVPQVYNKKYHSLPHSLHLLGNEKPRLAHKLTVDTLVKRKGRKLSSKTTPQNFDETFNKCHNPDYCSKHFDIYPNYRKFLYTCFRKQSCQLSNSPYVIHECCSKRGCTEAALELSETCNEKTYNEKKTRPINVIMEESRHSQYYKHHYRH